MWNRLGNVAGQTPSRPDVDFLPAIKALHDAGYHVLTVRSARPRRERGRQGAADLRPDGVARLRRRGRATCARARTSTASGSARSAPRRAATPCSTASGRAADQGRAGDPADPADALQHELRAHRARPARPGADQAGRLALRGCCARRGRAGRTRPSRRASSTAPSSSTSRAPATSGASWRSSRRSRPRRRTPRGRSSVPLDRALLGLPVHLEALGRCGRVLPRPRCRICLRHPRPAQVSDLRARRHGRRPSTSRGP